MIASVLLEAATRRSVPRMPFVVDGVHVGSVAQAHLSALATFARELRISAAQVEWLIAVPERDAAFARVHARLREQGLIRAWRDETYALRDPRTLAPLALIERAAARFWGALTFGAHATGYVADDQGRPTQLWIARRSPHKATDPDMLDNLIGAGVPHDQTPREALLREAWEEAGLSRAQAELAQEAGVLTLHRDIAEGLQHEWIYSFDLALPAGLVPQNQDGEVAAFTLVPPGRVKQLLLRNEMTVDAALVTLDFLRRHQLLGDDHVA